MSKLDKNSFQSADLPELDLFSTPPTQTSVNRVYYQDVRPLSQINGKDGPIDFHISNGGNDYIDLKKTRLYVKGKIVNSTDGSDVKVDAKLVPVQLLLHSLFNQIDVTLGDKLVSVSANTYSYKAYFQTLLSHGEAAKRGQLEAQLWTTETGNNLNSGDPAGQGNVGLQKRYAVTKESNVFDMEGPLAEDIFDIDKYLLNGVNITLKMYRNKPGFYLISDEQDPDFHFEILDIVIRVCKVAVDSGVLLAHNTALAKNTAKYPYKRRYCKMVTISPGHTTYVWDNMFNSFCPTRLLIGFGTAIATGGNVALNPYAFNIHPVSSITVYVDGETTAVKGLRLSDSTFVSAFNNLFEVWDRSDGDLGIHKENFGKGNALYAYEIEPFSSGNYLSLLKSANVRMEVMFANALTTSYSVIVYAEFPALLEIDKTRAVYLETAS
jgi:hypothetical protein